ncbi:hypothetical protein ACFSTA_06870 [Ornithinibacillus salinisoli]|uniref:DUF2269 family protein n=1 Tax=Ornithinibacillus salinisoli TaxID=1848459 RepID=A0ABW4VXA9_9BACI
MKLSMTARRGLITLHILFAAIMLGNMTTFLILSITSATTDDVSVMKSCYAIMHVLSKTSIKAATIGTTITGILLSLWTKWGFFKFKWVIVKEVLTVFLIVLNIWGMYGLTLNNLQELTVTGNGYNLSESQLTLWAGVIIQLISLIFIFGISVFKPWGQRKKRLNK